MYLRVVIICMFINLVSARAQSTDFKQIEDSTYYFYLTQQHNKQIEWCNYAIKHKIDYYYLRLRLANAYLLTDKLNSSNQQFFEAKKFAALDSFSEAKHIQLLTLIGNTEQLQLVQPNKKVLFTYLEAGSKISGKLDSIGSMGALQFGVKYGLNRKYTIYAGLSNLWQTLYWGSYNQQQLYLKNTFQLNHKIQLNIALSGLLTNITEIGLSSTSTSHYAISASAQKQINNITPYVNISYLNLNRLNQTQTGLGLLYYPLSNQNLVLNLQGIFHSLDSGIRQEKIMWIASISKGFKQKVWLSIDYFNANTSNFIEQDGFITNNNPDITIDRIGASLQWVITSNKTLFIVCQKERKNEYFFGSNYNLYNIFTGLKINLL